MIISEDKKKHAARQYWQKLIGICYICRLFCVNSKKSQRIVAALACFSASDAINRMNVNVKRTKKLDNVRFIINQEKVSMEKH